MTRTTVFARIGAVTALVAGSVIGTALPAQAADVGTIEDLQAAFDTDTVATLTGGISAPGTALTLPGGRSVTLDLGAFDLAVQTVTLGSGSTLTITGTTGTLTADASRAAADLPGIQTTGASLIINGATVVATGRANNAGIGGGMYGAAGAVTVNGGVVIASGGSTGAGIGGGYGGSGGTLTVTGGEVTATGGSAAAGIGGGYRGIGDPVSAGTVTVDGGIVKATGGNSGAAGIGSGADGSGAEVALNGGSTTAIAGAGAVSPVGPGARNTTFGSLTIAAGATLVLPEASNTQVIPSGVTVTNNGSIVPGEGGGAQLVQQGSGNTAGELVNNGVITLPTANITPPDRAFVTVNNCAFEYIDHGVSVGSERVYAPTFTAGARTMLPGVWNTAEDGSGDTVTADTDLTVGGGVITAETTPLYQQAIASITVTATPSTVMQGDTVTLTATATTPTGQTFDVTDEVTFSTDQGDTVTGDAFTPTTLADRVVTATLDGVTGTTTVEVTAAPITSIVVTAEPNPAIEGEPVTLTVNGYNEYGLVGDITDEVSFTTDQGDSITGGVFTPDTPVDRLVTATYGDLTAETTVTVFPAIVSIEVTADPVAVAEGGSSVLTVTAYGSDGAALGDVTEWSTFASDVATDVFDGNTVTFPSASPHTITATFDPGTGPLTDDVVIEVIPAPTPTPTPAPAPAPSGGDHLASTGADPAAPVALALALLLAGAAAMRLRRTRA